MKNSPIKDSGAREARNYAVNAKVAADDGNKKAEKYDKKEALISAADSSPAKMINLNNGHKTFMSRGTSPAKAVKGPKTEANSPKEDYSKKPPYKKENKITGAIGSDLRIQQYRDNNMALDNTTFQKKASKSVGNVSRQGIKGEAKKAAISVGNKVSQSKGVSTPNKPKGTTEKIVASSKPKTARETRQGARADRKSDRKESRISRLETKKTKVRAKGKAAVAAGETGVNSRAKDLKAREMRIQKRIDNKKAKR